MSTMAPTLPTSQQGQIPQGETRIAVRGVPWLTYELWVDSYRREVASAWPTMARISRS